jgi:type VI secretion system secreted protein VgrG
MTELAAADPKKLFRLKGALKFAFGKKAPWWMKVLRCTALVLSIYPAIEFGLMPNLPGRPLTAGETTELRQIFKDSVDYSKERIHSSKAMDFIVNPTERFTGNVIYGHTRGNVIIVNGEAKEDDYSSRRAGDFSREVFIHENVHIWQSQNCPWDMTCATIKEALKRQGGLDGFYTYHLEKGKDLLDYNIEQQAVIVTDYYLKVCKGDEPENCDNTEKGPALKSLYDGTLKNFKENPSYIKKFGYKLR